MSKNFNSFAKLIRLRLRSRLVFAILIFVIFGVISIGIIFSSPAMEDKVETFLEPNVVFLDNITIDYLIDNETFVRVLAKNGSYKMNGYNINLKNMELVYKKENTDMIIFADNASYEKERIIIADGNLKGRMNDIYFKGKEYSKLRYDYIEDNGSIKKGIRAMQNDNDIDAGTVLFGTQANGDIYFKDDVIVHYLVKDGKQD